MGHDVQRWLPLIALKIFIVQGRGVHLLFHSKVLNNTNKTIIIIIIILHNSIRRKNETIITVWYTMTIKNLQCILIYWFNKISFMYGIVKHIKYFKIYK